jgi:AraC family transcriptional regulator
MEPQIVSKEAFKVVGLYYRGKNENSEIPQMWGTFMSRAGEVKHMVQFPNAAYGVCDNMDHETGEFDYVAAFEVSQVEDVPEGMVGLEIPGGTYAVFTCTLPTLGETFDHVYQVWLPKSGYQRACGPEFELYDEQFSTDEPDSPMYIYIPVK